MADFAADLFSPPFTHFGGTQDSIPATLPQSFFVAPPTPPVVDMTPPVVSNFSPTQGSQIARTSAVGFDVTDAGGFARIFVTVWYPSTGVQEVAHDGTAFVGSFSSASSRVPIAGGFRYALIRSGGWPYAPTIRVYPIDTSGNQP